ncbi:hypothetical protein GCM10009557_45570 [Virgisporangium ochraceum]|uniref:Alpha-L-arabinofuranosidase B arabinose-binding domain-containing protein n=1 Tax=Virgisporangium ochraceum TaxID=65505 RepID=A0A8J4EGQ5_9ACTN|nr:family 43 glycosylhydrolase [Virgisporangium ochraceum]GIJ75040.1 hypothetical protein Voc01_099570 [Virgisporangium ochraceum]
MFSAHAAGRDRNIWAPELHRLDGSVVTIDGQLYFTWSGVPTTLWRDSDPHIYIVALSNPWTVTGPRAIISAPTRDRERQGTPMNEGPVALQRDGRTFITYSASTCQGPDYKIGQLTYTGGAVVSGSSWVKRSTPIFQRNDAAGVYGPAHHSFLTSPDGTETWIAYHANDAASQGEPAGPAVTVQRPRSFNFPDRFMRHSNYDVALVRNDGSATFAADPTFRPVS